MSERRSRVRIPLERVDYYRRRRVNYGTASLTVIACVALAAFICVVARCSP